MDENSMPLRLYSLGKDFKVIQTLEVTSFAEAKAIVEKHIEGSGYTNLRMVDDADYSQRFIADPPIGRKGRNVAAIDF